MILVDISQEIKKLCTHNVRKSIIQLTMLEQKMYFHFFPPPLAHHRHSNKNGSCSIVQSQFELSHFVEMRDTEYSQRESRSVSLRFEHKGVSRGLSPIISLSQPCPRDEEKQR